MRKSWLILLSGVLLTSLLFSGTAVFAQEAQGEELPLPEPGILPDSPFYVFDNLGKNIGLFFTFGPEGKAQKALQYAEERLAEAQAMAAENKSSGVGKAANGYDKFVAMAAEKAEEARQKGIPENISELVASATSKHLAALDTVAESFPEAVPEQARQAISRARGASMKGTESALKGVARGDPGRAAEIAMGAAEARLNRAKAKAGVNSEDVEEAIGEAEKLFEFGTEISEIAQGLGKGETTVEQLIAEATSTHLDILDEVRQRVPEQARSSVEDAMTKAAMARERAVVALRSEGNSGDIPEEAQAPETVPPQPREGPPGPGPGSGQSPVLEGATGEGINFRFLISDDVNAIEDFASVNVTISRIGLQSGGESGSWTELTPDVTEVDLKPLVGENAMEIWSSNITPGEYSKAFIYVTEVNGNLTAELGGNRANVKLPSEKLHISKPFSVSENITTSFVYDITVVKAGRSGQYILKPQIAHSGADQEFTEVEEEENGRGKNPEEAGKPEGLKFEGTIEIIDGTTWTVNIKGESMTVDVSEAEIEGEPDIGLHVKIEGSEENGQILAEEIEVEEIEIEEEEEQGREAPDEIGGRP